jgi:hypothetical protein
MPEAFTRADAKAHACSYILLSLLQRMDEKQPGLIEDLLAGARGDYEASKLQPNLPSAVPLIYEETFALLERAGAYKRNAQEKPESQ